MEKKWFEMAEIRKRGFDSAVWIPLRACEVTKLGKSGNLGYQEEFFGAGSLAIPLRRRKAAAKLGWHDLGLLQDHAGYADGHCYIAADEYADKELKGAVRLVISQRGNSAEPPTWHLHTDFVTTLGLKREGNLRLSMNEGYIEVVRLKLEDDRPKGQPRWPSEKKAYNRRVGAAISRGSAERRGQGVGKDDR